MMAIPMCLLFELGLLFARWFGTTTPETPAATDSSNG